MHRERLKAFDISRLNDVSTIEAATHEEESPADDDKFDQILSRIENGEFDRAT